MYTALARPWALPPAPKKGSEHLETIFLALCPRQDSEAALYNIYIISQLEMI